LSELPSLILVLALENSEALEIELTKLYDETYNEEIEDKVRDIRRQILASFKFLSDMAFSNLIEI
jgi:hypothetical protein